MILLVPKWAHNYDEFWNAIRRRNLWFIQLRYLFVFLLISFLSFGEYFLEVNLSIVQIYGISSITITILIYNLFLHYIRPKVGRTPGNFNCMHLSLIQMLLDLTSLMLLVFYTGVIDSPFYPFFIFQIVIGSMILRGSVVYVITSITIIIFVILVFFQFHQLIPTHYISGIYNEIPTHPFSYVILSVAFFSLKLLFLVYLANTISNRLYKRERQLRESLTKLDEAEITKQKYIMGVVHEIKSPIAAVQSILDLVLHKFLGPVEEPIETKLSRARQRSEEAIRLINNVLRISKIKLLNDTSSEEMSIIEILEKIIAKKSEIAEAKKITVKIDDKKGIQKLVKGDPLLIEIALSNILGNSLKYGVENGRMIIYLSEPDPDKLSIEICDDGIGIPKNELETIFLQFYRASNVKQSDDFEGSGMGLAVVKEIIEHHGGTISVSSPSKIGNESAPGTSVKIILPETNVRRVKRKTVMYD